MEGWREEKTEEKRSRKKIILSEEDFVYIFDVLGSLFRYIIKRLSVKIVNQKVYKGGTKR